MSLLLSLLLAAPPAPRPTAVQWSAPGECPAASGFAAALVFRTDKVAVVGAGETPTAWLDVVITRQVERYAGVISVRLPSGSTSRNVSGRRCESVVEALSLIAALLIDPDHAKTAPLPPEVLQPTPTEPLLSPPIVVPTDPPRAVEPAPVVVESPPTVLAPPPAPSPAPASWKVRLAAGGHGTTAISGLLDLGGHASVSLERGRLVARLTLGGGPGATVQAATGRARYPFHLLTSLEGGAGLELGAFFGEATLCAMLLAFSVTALDAIEPAVVWRWILPVGPALRAGLVFGSLRVGVAVHGGLNLRRDTYVVTPDGEVFVTPLLFIHPAVFVSYTL
ncbi:MAG: hypothetical protein JNJ54_33225 [Myxococcaceae bacterium]|nr:hypothetical protein [Myxococcaceae bacterium]